MDLLRQVVMNELPAVIADNVTKELREHFSIDGVKDISQKDVELTVSTQVDALKVWFEERLQFSNSTQFATQLASGPGKSFVFLLNTNYPSSIRNHFIIIILCLLPAQDK
jgi:hypothetical protein